MKKKLLISVGALLLLGGILTVVWLICDWPPPRLILKYGMPPAGGPTGRRLTVEGIEFIELRPGYFPMGVLRGQSTLSALAKFLDAHGVTWVEAHRKDWVEINAPFWLAKTELTISQWSGVQFPERVSRSMLPAGNLSWSASLEISRSLSHAVGYEVYIPNEVEWEYAARAGTTSDRFFDEEAHNLSEFAWCHSSPGIVSRSDSHAQLSSAATLKQNPWGFFDVYGNVSEWCGTDPRTLKSARREASEYTKCVLRGGAVVYLEQYLNSVSRIPAIQGHSETWTAYVGVRLALSLKR